MQTIPLYSKDVPLALGHAEHDRPTLDIYEPFGETFHDAAIILLPGGGYEFLSAQEGEGYAGLFQLWGFKCFVCNYRLGSNQYRHPAMLMDAARAVRVVRAHAVEWKINPNKIIIIGSSAGGHLAATLMNHWDEGDQQNEDPVERVSSQPNLGILSYPVLTMKEFAHEGSRLNLLGKEPSETLKHTLSAECQVSAKTPPCFIWHTHEDSCVSVDNVLLYTNALHAAAIPFELHIYQDGGHGLGMKDGVIPWQTDCLTWLRKRLNTSS